jgi:carbon-monoxide dehydrogenase large subunit
VLGGGAVLVAAEAVQEKATAIASHLLEVAPSDLEWADGGLRPRGSPDRRVTLAEIADAAYARPFLLPPDTDPGLESTRAYLPPPATFSNAAHGCVVEVDPELGTVRLERYVVVEDCGTVIDLDNVDGQVHGGTGHGIGHALFEHAAYDDSGQPVFAALFDYLLPSAGDVPAIEVHHLSSPSPFTKAGIKGMGEGGALGPPAAIASAVDDALAPFSVFVTELPISPPALRTLLRSGRSART